LAFVPTHAANHAVVKAAHVFYAKVPAYYVKMPYSLRCPS
jgi:hypothetical protein